MLKYFIAILALEFISAATTDVKITATPPSVEEGVTPNLIINCSYPKPPPGESFLSLIVTRKSLVGDQHIKELASISAYNGAKPINVGNTQAYLTGSATSNAASFIAMSFDTPKSEHAGLYSCEASLMDDLGHPRTQTAEILVTEELSLLQEYSATLQNLSNKIQSAESCCSSLQTTMDDLENTGNNLVNALAFVQTSIMFEAQVPYAGHKYYMSNHGVDSVDIAQASCEIMNGYLAEIANAAEWVFVSVLLRKVAVAEAKTNGSVVLLGGQDTTAEGVWFWTHSKTLVKYTAWQAGHPSDVNHTRNCLAMTSKATGSQSWIDIPCELDVATQSTAGKSDVRFLCEVDP